MIAATTESDASVAKRPTIALLGEFSAGKSTLANVLLGADQSTVRVTATQAPPIWYVQGTGAPVRISTDGTETEIEDGALSDLSLQDTCAVRIPRQAEVLDHFSLIDMPGSSDPNMSPDIWDALLPKADIAIWCTPATQAWRQSEAAIWEMVPDTLHARSLLLLTRMDKVTSVVDRNRIITRVERETKGLFSAVLPVSLLEASRPIVQCEASGMGHVLRALARTTTGAAPEQSASVQPSPARQADPVKPRPQLIPRRVSMQTLPANRRIIRRPRAEEGMT